MLNSILFFFLYTFLLLSFPAQFICTTESSGGQSENHFSVNDKAEKCLGYEPGCTRGRTWTYPVCTDGYTGWAKTQQEAEDLFFKQADYGYIREIRKSLSRFCLPENGNSSSVKGNKDQRSGLECSKDLLFCRATNIMLDLRGIEDRVTTESLRYKMDILKPGDIALNCRLDTEKLKKNLNNLSPLQSWAPELRNLKDGLQMDSDCDFVVDTPTYIMKLDATVNMYHHFCDFFNLFSSLYLLKDSSGPSYRQGFTKDNQILVWDNYRYQSNFADVWSAFTDRPLWSLTHLAGRRVCFRNAVFPLLPRMMFGLYYNTPVVPGCSGSALFSAFSRFIVNRLDIPYYSSRMSSSGEANGAMLRVTLLCRDTKYRRILNEEQLVEALTKTRRYEVKIARFTHTTPFIDQLTTVRNTDILIGMHGAGLTHLLFLPDWAGLFELYHCGDPGCYGDLARLRGVKYITWEREDLVYPEESSDGGGSDSVTRQGGAAHQKFVNYRFDPDEFIRLVDELADGILMDPNFIQKDHNSGNNDPYLDVLKGLHRGNSADQVQHLGDERDQVDHRRDRTEF